MKPPVWRRVLTVAGIALVALTMVGLGGWQLSRLQQRRALNTDIRRQLAQPPIVLSRQLPDGPEQLDYRPVTVRGEFDFANEVVWRNRARAGAPGVHVLTPLRIAGSDVAVLVDRGWIPYTASAPEARAPYQTPMGEVLITGILRRSQLRASSLLPADTPLGPGQPRLDAWFWVDLDQIQAQMPYPLLPMFIVERGRPDPAQLPISGDEVDLGDGPHLGYAIQWFVFAAIGVVGPLVYRYHSRRRRK